MYRVLNEALEVITADSKSPENASKALISKAHTNTKLIFAYENLGVYFPNIS